jgi:hypothetical protein|nr:MAG TPA: hypothetical protein [Caudoviricetes sp.]
MNKEELLKEIMKLPKIETNNPISAMNGINVDDLMSAVDRLNKIPDYNDLLKENKELKKQLEDMTLCRDIASGHREEVQDREAILLTQQKEFIKYLEGYLNLFDYDQISCDMIEEILQKYKSIIGVSDENKRI